MNVRWWRRPPRSLTAFEAAAALGIAEAELRAYFAIPPDAPDVEINPEVVIYLLMRLRDDPQFIRAIRGEKGLVFMDGKVRS